jgi:transcriptional regulator with XRE-family HTH domain
MYSIEYIPFMHVGHHIMAWRRRRELTQAGLAERANLSRPYLSRLEKGKADPALSALRRLALALEITVGQLVEELPPEKSLGRDEMDRLARGALRPGTQEAHAQSGTRVLALLNRERRQALGLYVPRNQGAPATPGPHASGVNASRWLRASLGEKQWNALLRRIDKLASAAPLEP